MTSLNETWLRNSLKEMYPNSKFWHQKVDRMPKNQVYAIYMRFEEQREKEEREKLYIQATLF